MRYEGPLQSYLLKPENRSGLSFLSSVFLNHSICLHLYSKQQSMKIKFPEAEKFIAEYKHKFAGKLITSYETEYKITDLVFEEGEIFALVIMTASPDNALKLTMDIDRAAELCGISVDWVASGFKVKR